MYIEALKSQINSLRHQLELSKKVHEADLRTAKEDFDRKVELSLKERNQSLMLQREKIRDLENSIKEEKERAWSLNRELCELEEKCSLEISAYAEKKKFLDQDLKVLTDELNTQKAHIKILQNELCAIEKDHDESLNFISSKFDSSSSAMNTQAISNKNKIKALEREIEEMRKKLSAKDTSSEIDMKTLEEALRSTYHTVELQTISIEKLRKSTDDTLREASQYSKMKSNLEHQEAQLTEENSKLKESIDKLERKIYGRASRN
ncbi:hypothetical protein SteCoe_28166 [Stentor coeruleus]|uniref:Uncharacterized protein n=1 Tax=Stentor coeruleus TaxID=5963 RepID=A0A1R2B8S7_9CILI|nr:hypothetical protein SteCoe_28166 [Stentor coeruleus]